MAGNKKNNSNLPAKSGSHGFGKAFVSGNAVTKLSALVFGLGNILHKQIIRGLLYLALECAYVVYMINFGIGAIRDLFTLGTKVQEEVFNEAKQVYEYIVGDNSMLCLLYGVVTIFVTLLFLLILTSSVKSAYETQLNIKEGKKLPTFIDDLKALKHE